MEGLIEVLLNYLKFLHEILPQDNTLSTSHYEAKKILRPMGLEY